MANPEERATLASLDEELSFEELMEYLSTIDPTRLPVYLVFIDIFVYDYAEQECFDCRLRGGSTTPPDFWE